MFRVKYIFNENLAVYGIIIRDTTESRNPKKYLEN